MGLVTITGLRVLPLPKSNLERSAHLKCFTECLSLSFIFLSCFSIIFSIPLYFPFPSLSHQSCGVHVIGSIGTPARETDRLSDSSRVDKLAGEVNWKLN